MYTAREEIIKNYKSSIQIKVYTEYFTITFINKSILEHY